MCSLAQPAPSESLQHQGCSRPRTIPVSGTGSSCWDPPSPAKADPLLLGAPARAAWNGIHPQEFSSITKRSTTPVGKPQPRATGEASANPALEAATVPSSLGDTNAPQGTTLSFFIHLSFKHGNCNAFIPEHRGHPWVGVSLTHPFAISHKRDAHLFPAPQKPSEPFCIP